ncbi:hypothetical protein F5B18DRAFT_30179 [Nemania serpens]|nr:hypothetical protein F5B18DRAFT_30179 [Nemania serpens]
MATNTIQIDPNQVPAVQNALGHVLITGQFQCTRMDRHGVATNYACNSVMNNKVGSIKSHLNKIHNPESKYAKSQASYAKDNNLEPLTCDRPRLDGKGWCFCKPSAGHTLVSHARHVHKFRGKSASLSKRWTDLNAMQQAYYIERVDLEVRRQLNGGFYTPWDEVLNERLEKEWFPGV